MKSRYGLRLLLRCPVIFTSDEAVGEGTLLDLGLPGCAVESDVVPLPNQYLRLHILSPDEQGPFKIQLAKVRWAETRRFGVEFLSFDDGQKLTIRRLFAAITVRTPCNESASQRR